MYEVEWTDEASEDLVVKVKSEAVADELVAVANQALDAPESVDGGRLGPQLWRRGLTPERRAELDAPGAPDQDGSGDRARDYVLVYQGLGMGRLGYRVLAIYTLGELGAGLDDVPDLDHLPQ